MKNVSTVFGTVIYRSACRYMDDFIESLNQQEAVFDLLIINDGCGNEVETEIIEKSKHKIIIINYLEMMSPGELRIKLMLEAKERGYDLLILGDFDDLFAADRVKQYQEEYDPQIGFFYNYLYDFNGKKILGEMPEHTNSFVDILEYNYLGLTNTGLNMHLLSEDFLRNVSMEKIEVFDWYFYTRLLLKGAKGKLINNTKTYYRIHNNNIAGIVEGVPSLKKIKQEIDVKIRHYTALRKHSYIYREKSEKYEKLALCIDDIYESENWERDNCYWWGIIV